MIIEDKKSSLNLKNKNDKKHEHVTCNSET